ncbi:hypothetical protein Pyn_18844 [Prunus yedoensis var. nudiflora]|uniref:Uncharacterized protein n=1 Tax=Prunus yedoensis var. nudiflora TaxID=2094558 RepID=A0A314YZD0_PRUYE|nr:hypothetical protein Pyn_18844 [Prunus yedoensis var. nudiflora]
MASLHYRVTGNPPNYSDCDLFTMEMHHGGHFLLVGLVQVTWRFDEDGRTWYDGCDVAELIRPSAPVASVAGLTALITAGVMVLTIARMTTACHGQSDGRYHA